MTTPAISIPKSKAAERLANDATAAGYNVLVFNHGYGVSLDIRRILPDSTLELAGWASWGTGSRGIRVERVAYKSPSARSSINVRTIANLRDRLGLEA
jgi:hypothetical protein